jgi:CTP synthase
VNIALVGKYTRLEDAYASVVKALQHASVKSGYKLNLTFIDAVHLESETKESSPILYHKAWQQLCSTDGVIVPGGFGERGINGMIETCKWCRLQNKPLLGICLGLQTIVIEFARNVLKLENANSTEFDQDCENPVIIDMPEHNQGNMGGTMRLGKRSTRFVTPISVIRQLYGNPEIIQERHRHRYEVNPKYVANLEAFGLKFVGHDEENIRMEIVELEGHDYYVATQYHPEYLTRPLKPSPPFLGLILASVGKLKAYLTKNCRISPSQLSDNDSDDGPLIACRHTQKV